MSQRRPPSSAIAIVSAVMLLTACTPGPPHEPQVGQFSAGTCRQGAPALIAVDRLVHQVRDQHKKPRVIGPALSNAQRQLSAIPAGADPTADKLLAALVVDIGVLRISIDTNNYQQVRLDRVARAQQAVVAHCTHKG